MDNTEKQKYRQVYETIDTPLGPAQVCLTVDLPLGSTRWVNVGLLITNSCDLKQAITWGQELHGWRVVVGLHLPAADRWTHPPGTVEAVVRSMTRAALIHLQSLELLPPDVEVPRG